MREHGTPPTIAGFPIRRKLGEGGMGVVYLAHDPKLDRPLAIKVLSEAFTSDPSRLALVRSEARMLASLNHPNVATIYDLVEHDDGVALILEFIEGESLADRVRRGPLPLTDALGVCIQVAEALEATHERGVLHLDLKPANVMVTPKGRVKLLDFGLARSISVRAGVAEPFHPDASRTLAIEPVGPRITGTPGYMSPEQLRGLPLGATTDVFSFGCVLFECLTGTRAFQGATFSDAVASTLAGEPDWQMLPPSTPDSIRELIECCLEREPKSRLQRIGKARCTLANALKALGPERGDHRPAVARNNLPAMLTTFVGRWREMAELHALFGSTRMLTLTGTGGCGKSRLALELAQQLLTEYPDGVWLVQLASVSDPSRVAHAVAGVLQVKEEPGRGVEEALADHLKHRHVLLILDNCEHVLFSTAALADRLLGDCPYLRILATSRERLAIAGEQDYQVPSLTLPDVRTHTSLALLAQVESVRLFTDRAKLVRSDWSFTEYKAAATAEICRRLDGIPLAIELAAARVRVLPVEQILEKLNDRFRLLTTGDARSLPRHQTLRAALDWSHDLLSPPEQCLLRSLSVFAGGWTLDAATFVAGEGLDEFEMLDLMTHLVDKSLVLMDRGASNEARYRFLETVRDYAQEKLAEHPGALLLRDRHLEHFLRLGEEAAKHFLGPNQASWYQRLELEHENLLQALDWSARTEAGVERGLRLTGAIWPFWEAHCYFTLGRAAAERALREDRGAEPTAIRAKALAAAGNLAWGQNDLPAARAHHEAGLAIQRQLGKPKGIASCLGSLGLVAADLGEFAQARQLYEESLRIFRELGDMTGVAKTLGNLAIVARNEGDAETARRLQEECLRIHVERGEVRSMMITYHNLAVISLAGHEYQRARGEIRKSLRLAVRLGDKLHAVLAMERASEMLCALKDAMPALRLRAAAAGVRDELGVPVRRGALDERAAFLEKMHAMLDDASFAREWEEGYCLPFQAAVDYCLNHLGAGNGSAEDDPGAALLPTEEPARRAGCQEETRVVFPRGSSAHLTPD